MFGGRPARWKRWCSSQETWCTLPPAVFGKPLLDNVLRFVQRQTRSDGRVCWVLCQHSTVGQTLLVLQNAWVFDGLVALWPLQASRPVLLLCWAHKSSDVQAAAGSTSAPVFFTGEMVFPWMFEDLAALRPLKAVANAVAEAEGWSKLYHSEALGAGRVPAASATYCEVRSRPLFPCCEGG